MAHSTATAAATGEVNYIIQDANGKIFEVVKHSDIKQEPIDPSTVYTTAVNSNMGAFNQINTINQPQYVRIHNNYNSQPEQSGTYTIITPQSSTSRNGNNMQQSLTVLKYETIDEYNNTLSNVKNEQRYSKYATPNNNTKTKSKLHVTSSTNASVQRKRKPEKAGKGLRHFSMKVWEKVKEKGTTTYNEVADELVTEELQNNSFDTANCDQKNIRRRVYDALNVLMAMNIISKDKKEIRWINLPTSSAEECSDVEKTNEERRERIKQKQQQLRELIQQLVSFKSLISRNKEAERQGIVPTPNSSIQLPFIIVNTHKSTKINCSVTNDKSEYIFKFDDKFEMHDDAEVLKCMGLLCGLDKGQCSYQDIERAKKLVPPNFGKYVEAYGSGKDITNPDFDDELQLIDPQAYSASSSNVVVKTPDIEEEEFLENSDID